MQKSEIVKLDNKDLQLRYYLGGLLSMSSSDTYCNYWICSINCECSAVIDDEKLEAVKDFIKKHHFTNERFLKLAYNYLIGAIMRYQGEYSPLFQELAKVIEPYQFSQNKQGEIPDNDFGEEELEKIVYGSSTVSNFIRKYNLTIYDFITIAKTNLNYNFHRLRVSNPDDTFIAEIKDITDQYSLTVDKEYIEEYRKDYQNKKKTDKLAINARAIQKKYLGIMKELLIQNPDLATEMLADELNELGINKKKDIKRLIKKKQ